MNEPTISLCMIVKNEEAVLDKCLESVKNFVDEIIVVDTGSTDATKSIAAKHQAKIYDFSWNDDFSEARNFAKKQATKEWILQMDADEYFIGEEAKKLKEEIKKTTKEALAIRISNLVAANMLGSSHIYYRIYKNSPEIFYIHQVHEQLTKQGGAIDFDMTSVRIMHTGYIKETMEKKEKHKRNLSLLKEELKKKPEDGFVHLNMSTEYLIQKKFAKSLGYAKEAYRLSEGKSYRYHAVLNIIKNLIHLKWFQEAIQVARDAQEVYEELTDLRFLEATALEAYGMEEDAIQKFNECIQKGESNSLYYTVKGVGSLIPGMKISQLHLKNRKFEEAMDYLTLLLAMNKWDLSVAGSVTGVMKRTLEEADLLAYLENLYPGDTEREMDIKYELLHRARNAEGIIKYSPRIHQSSLYEIYECRFYSELVTGKWEKLKKDLLLLIDQNGKDYSLFGMVYYLQTTDSDIKALLCEKDKRAKILLDILEHRQGKKKQTDASLFVALLKEMVLQKKYNEIEKLLPLCEQFVPQVYKEIARIFEDHYYDDLSIEYYSKYLTYHKQDYKVQVRLAELLLAAEMYEEAMMIAKNAFALKQNHFKPIEIIIDSLKKLNLTEDLPGICKEMLELFPESNYLIEQLVESF